MSAVGVAGSPVRGTLRMCRLQGRTGWPGLVGLVLAVALPVIGTAASMVALYPQPEQRAIYRATVGESVASAAFNGRPYDLDRLGGIVAFESGIFTQIVLPVLVVLLTVRRTRGEEEAGRLELITARPVGRLAPPAATAICLALALLAAGVATAGGLVAVGLPWPGAGWYAVAQVGLGLFFLAVGALAAQLGSTTRAALGLASGTLVLAYVTRFVVDARRLGATWLSPLSWTAEVRPFGASRLWPLVALLVATVGLGAVAAVLADRRDVGAGFVAERRGPARGAMTGLAGLWWRTSRAAFVGWLATVVFWSGSLGAVCPEMVTMFRANPSLAAAMGVAPGHEADALIVLSVACVALLAVACGLAVISRAALEESSGRLGLLLATPTSRGQWSRLSIAVALVQSLAVVVVGGLVLGLALAGSTGSADYMIQALRAAVGAMPAVAVIVCLAGLLVGIEPRLRAVAWAWYALIVTVALLADTLRLPQWVRELSPLELTGRLPAQEYRPVAAAVLFILAGCAVGGAGWSFRRRDLAAG